MGFVRLGRDHDRGNRHHGSDGHHGRRHHGRRHHGGHHAYFYFGYPYYAFYPYFGFGSYGYAYGYGYYPGYRYGGYPGYGYGSSYVDSNVYGYFDIDVYELDQGESYASVYPTTPLVEQSYAASRDPNALDTGLPTGSAPSVVDRQNQLADSMLAEGQTAMVGGRFEDARRLFSQAMFLDDRDGRAKLLFALASLAKGEIDLAGLALRRALLTTPELIDNPWDLRTLFPTGQVGLPDSETGLPDEQAFQRQLDKLGQYLSDYKEHRGARLLLGYLHFGWGDAERAHAMFSKLVLSDPKDTLAIRLRDSAAWIMSQAGQ